MFLYVRISVGNLSILSAQIKIHFIELGIFKDSSPEFIFQSVEIGNILSASRRPSKSQNGTSRITFDNKDDIVNNLSLTSFLHFITH